MNKNIIGLALLWLCLAATMSACNTTAGVGRDLEAAGEAIEQEAEENKGY